jgi:chromosome segregation ATPase
VDPHGHERRGAGRGRRALGTLRARLDALRQEPPAHRDTIEALRRERLEQRLEIERLAAQLRQARAALARAYQELETRSRTAVPREAPSAGGAGDRGPVERALRDLEARLDALRRDREFAIERVEAALAWLRPAR